MLSRRLLLALAAALLLALPVLAAPNFTGDWKLNVAKSDFGPMPGPSSMFMKITEEDPKLKMAGKQSGDQGDIDFDFNYTTDGKECTNTIMGMEIKSVLKWDGDVLVIDSKGSFNGDPVTVVDKMSLSADGKIMTIARHMSSSMGDADIKLQFEKQ